ncbi:hypothetical protein HDU97_007791 [Phlyctochytrium planicorne]|nr:hypothetical protein HDU97_007791 [Phlyctochytrium planicorne]
MVIIAIILTSSSSTVSAQDVPLPTGTVNPATFTFSSAQPTKTAVSALTLPALAVPFLNTSLCTISASFEAKFSECLYAADADREALPADCRSKIEPFTSNLTFYNEPVCACGVRQNFVNCLIEIGCKAGAEDFKRFVPNCYKNGVAVTEGVFTKPLTTDAAAATVGVSTTTGANGKPSAAAGAGGVGALAMAVMTLVAVALL